MQPQSRSPRSNSKRQHDGSGVHAHFKTARNLARKRSLSDIHMHYTFKRPSPPSSETNEAHEPDEACEESKAPADEPRKIFQNMVLSPSRDPLSSLLAKLRDLKERAEELVSVLPKQGEDLTELQRRDDGFAYLDRLARRLKKKKKEQEEANGHTFRWYVTDKQRWEEENDDTEGPGGFDGELAREQNVWVFIELRDCVEQAAQIIAKTKRMGLKGCLGGMEWAWGVAALAAGYFKHDPTIIRLKTLLLYRLRRQDESPGVGGSISETVRAAIRLWAMLEHDLSRVRLLYLVEVMDAWRGRMECILSLVEELESVGYPFPLQPPPASRRNRRATGVVRGQPPSDLFVDEGNTTSGSEASSSDSKAGMTGTHSRENSNTQESQGFEMRTEAAENTAGKPLDLRNVNPRPPLARKVTF